MRTPGETNYRKYTTENYKPPRFHSSSLATTTAPSPNASTYSRWPTLNPRCEDPRSTSAPRPSAYSCSGLHLQCPHSNSLTLNTHSLNRKLHHSNFGPLYFNLYTQTITLNRRV